MLYYFDNIGDLVSPVEVFWYRIFSCSIQKSCKGSYISAGMEHMSPFVSNVNEDQFRKAIAIEFDVCHLYFFKFTGVFNTSNHPSRVIVLLILGEVNFRYPLFRHHVLDGIFNFFVKFNLLFRKIDVFHTLLYVERWLTSPLPFLCYNLVLIEIHVIILIHMAFLPCCQLLGGDGIKFQAFCDVLECFLFRIEILPLI